MCMTVKVLALSALVMVMVGPPLLSESAPQPGSGPADAAAVKQFDDAIAQYLALRQALRSEVAGPVKESTAVQLNNGEKWEANRETTEGIHRMEMLTSDFKGAGNAEEVLALKNQMEFEFNQILEQCTMTGEAHNQLHNYLIPLKAMINKIDTGNAHEQEKNFREMQHYLEMYSSFFS